MLSDAEFLKSLCIAPCSIPEPQRSPVWRIEESALEVVENDDGVECVQVPVADWRDLERTNHEMMAQVMRLRDKYDGDRMDSSASLGLAFTFALVAFCAGVVLASSR